MRVSGIRSLTADMKEICLDIKGFEKEFSFKAGMHVHVAQIIDDKEEIRSYSICNSGPDYIAIGVKLVQNGKVSTFLCNSLNVDDLLTVSLPTGSFVLNDNDENILAIAAGSGITPIVSMLKNRENHNRSSVLLFGNKTLADVPFREELDSLNRTNTKYYLSQEEHSHHVSGRIDKDALTTFIKSDLNILRCDGFYLCGPEELIVQSKEVLESFGVQKEKIHFELFTTPVLMKPEKKDDQNEFVGVANVEVILDGETILLELKGDGKSILDAVNDLGYDAPYSCRGGVCSTCKAKVTEGAAKMEINYALTDKEVGEGYILTCQAHPCSPKIKVNYDA